MKGQPTAGFWRAVVQCALGCLVLALVTFACFRLQVGSTIPALLYLLAVVLVALSGSFAASVFVAVLAVLCLQYFFVAPLFSLRVADPMDAVAGGVFLATALAVTRLMTARRRAEKAQREQEALLDVTHDAIFVRSLSDDVITYWNRAAEESYGWSNGEAIGAVPHELLNTVFPVPVEEILAEVTRAGRWEGELVHTRRDGTKVVVASRWSLQHDDEGLPAAILETNNDITVRKRAEAELRASEQQWRDVFENNPTMYFMVDAGGNVVSVNPFGAEQLGYTVNELVGQPVLNVFHHSDREAVQREVALCLEQVGRARSWEARKVRKDGIVLPVRETAKAVPRVNGPIILIACEDITERKRAEEALRRQANLLEQTHDAIFIWERPNRITYWNRGAEQLYGFSRAEAIGRAGHELLQTVHPLPIPLFEAALERDGRWTGELTQTARDGRRIIVESRHWLTRESDGRQVVLETNRDITERKRAEDAWRQAEAELAHVTRVATMGELAASLAHELNQSLTGVVTNATACLRWLDREPPNREKATDAVRRIIRDANRASEVIVHTRGLLKKSDAEKSPLDLSEVLREILALAQPELTRHRIVLQEFLAEDLPYVLGVRVQLQQVALNLIMNGVDAMADVSDRSRELVIRSQRHEIDGGPGVVVAVQDAGTGIADETRDHLFEPFYTTKSHGLGMGLSISRSIIQAHGGRLWATPNAGAGATFQFVLPARSDPGP